MGFDALARLSEEEGKCWAFGESRRVVPAEVAREVVSAIQAERDDLAARLAELEGQEPVAWMGFGPRDGRPEFSISKPAGCVMRDFSMRPVFARPDSAKPVNVDFGKRGENMFFQIGNQSFLLDYKPEEQGEFEFMKAMLLSAFSRITHGVKTESQPVNARILDVSTGKLEHINAGLCPDSINGPDSRDPATLYTCESGDSIATRKKYLCSREEMEAQKEKIK